MKTQEEIARSTAFLSFMPRQTQDALLALSERVSLKSGSRLFSEGDRSSAVFLVTAGVLKLSNATETGAEAIVGVYVAGESVAEALALTGQPYPMDATAVTNCNLLAIPHDALEGLIAKDTTIAVSLMQATCQHVHQMIHQLRDLKMKNGTQRVAQFLLEQSQKAGEPVFFLPYDKVLIAGRLGLKPESLSRSFRNLRKLGVKVTGQTVTLENPTSLARYAQTGTEE